VYINFWYPVGRSEDLVAGAPLAVRVLGLPFVAFLASGGGAHVLSVTCVNRGG
jgi:phenylpropionate dioxygenase-like ring-hydroxylating dioxygenase large terminal subunit